MCAVVGTGRETPHERDRADRVRPTRRCLELREIDRPVAKDGEVLVRVHAASLHPDVWHTVRGVPYVLRLMGSGLRKPKLRVPGIDLAGRVEAIGTQRDAVPTG